jgi:hypothetical protein
MSIFSSVEIGGIPLRLAFWKQKPATVDLPADCCICFGIPLTRQEFLDAAANEPEYGFVRGWLENSSGRTANDLWNLYEPVAGFVSELTGELESLGVQVVPRAKLADWEACVSDGRRVTSLFAHWYGQGIQFATGFIPVRDVVECIPPGYTGTLDLTVCFSVRLLDAVKQRAPACTVIGNRKRAGLSTRLAIYHQTMRLLATGRFNFADAMQQVHLAGLQLL